MSKQFGFRDFFSRNNNSNKNFSHHSNNMNGMENMNSMDSNNSNEPMESVAQGDKLTGGRPRRRLWKILSPIAVGALLVSGLSIVAVAANNTVAPAPQAKAAVGNNITTPTPSPLGSAYTATWNTASGAYWTGNSVLNQNWLYEGYSANPYMANFSNYNSDGSLASGSLSPMITGINAGSPTTGLDAEQLDTLALDSGTQDGNSPEFYGWGWASGNSLTNAAITGATIPTPASAYTTVVGFPANQSNGQVVPDKVYFVPNPNNSGQTNPNATNGQFLYNYWSGGEVDQQTGRIYFSPGELSTINNSEMMIFNPKDGTYNASGIIKPANPNQTVTGYLASDMTIDSQGNAYMMGSVGPAAVPPGGGAAQVTSYLIKVTPGTPGNWTYSLVTPLWFYNTSTQAYTSMNTGYMADAYAMGFLNGYLYANFLTTPQGGVTTVDQINPRTGVVQAVGGTVASAGIGSNLTGGPYGIQDFASPQSAAILTGTVYNDAAGTGQIVTSGTNQTPGAPNETVQLYDANGNVIGQQLTNAQGQYSFIMPNTNTASNYYVRVVQPQVGGANAVQTWSSVQNDNGAAPNGNPGQLMSYGQPTTSTAPQTPYVDPAAPAAPAGGSSTGGAADLTKVAAYTQVQVNTANDVTTANFAVSSTGSYGDGPADSPVAQKGPQHVEGSVSGQSPSLWLGTKDGEYQDGSTTAGLHAATNDGVTLQVASGAVNPQGQVLAAGSSYTFNYQVSGSNAGKANVYAWLPTTNGGTTWGSGVTGAPTTGGAAGTGTLSVTLPTAGVATNSVQTEYMRVDASSNSSITASTPNNSTGAYAPAVGSTASNTQTWTSDGETEDYQIGVANAVLHMQVTSDAAGTYNYGLTNIVNSAPSSTSDSLTFNQSGTITSTTAHAISAVGTNVVVTPTNTASQPANEALSSATLVNTTTGAALTGANAPTISGTAPNQVITIPGVALTQGADVTLQLTYGQSASPTVSSWTVSPTSIAADGTTKSTVVITAKSAGGTALSGQTVSLATDPTTDLANFKVSNFTDNNDGTYTATVTSTVAGTYTLEAFVNIDGKTTQITNPSTQTLTVTPLPMDSGTSSFSVDPTHVTVGDTTGVPVTVTTKDVNGNLTSGTVTLTVDQKGGTQPVFVNGNSSAPNTINVTTGTSGASLGTATVHITSTASGSFTVSGAVGSDTVKADPAANNVANFDPDIPAPGGNYSTFTVSPTAVASDGVAYATGTATILDKYGNVPLTTSTVDFTVPAGVTKVTSAASTLTPVGGKVSVTTDPTTGKATVQYYSTVAGTVTLDAYVGSTQVGEDQSLTFNSGISGSGTWTVTANKTGGITANGNVNNTNDAYTGVVTTTDGNDNAVGGVNVNLTVAPSGGTTSILSGLQYSVNGGTATAVPSNGVISVTTASTTGGGLTKGQATVVFTSTTAGTNTVSAAIASGQSNATAGPIGTAQTLTFVPGPGVLPNSEFKVSANSAQVVTGSITGTVTIQDADKNGVPGVSVNIGLPSAISALKVTDSNGNTLAPDANNQVTVITDASGVAQFTLTSTSSGTGSVSAVIPNTATNAQPGTVPGSPQTITFNPGTSGSGTWTVTANKTGDITANGNVNNTNDAYTGVVTTTDSDGNAVGGVNVNLTVAPSGGTTSILSGLQYSVNGGTATAVPSNGVISVTTASTTGGGLTTGQATVVFTSTTAGTNTVSAAIASGQSNATAGSIGTAQTLTFVSGPAVLVNSNWTLAPQSSVTANGKDAYTITVNTNDANNNPVSGVTVNVTVPTFDGMAAVVNGTALASIPSTGVIPVITADGTNGTTKGQGIITLTSTGIGSGAVTAAIASGPTGTQVGALTAPNYNTINFVSQQIDPTKSSFTVVSTPTTAATAGSQAVNVTVHAADINSNPVSAGVTLSVPSPAEFVGGTTSNGYSTVTVTTGDGNNGTTNGAGSAQINSTVAGSYVVTATVAGSSAVVNATSAGGVTANTAYFAAGSINLTKSSWSVTPTGSLPSDGKSSFVGTAKVTDVNDNPENGVTISVAVPVAAIPGLQAYAGSTVSGSPLTISGGAVQIVTGTDGTAAVTFVSNSSGSGNVTASVASGGPSGSPTGQIGQPQPISFNSGPPDPTKSTWSVSPTTSQTVGPNPAFTVTVNLKDSNSNAVSGQASAIQIGTTSAGIQGGINIGQVTDAGNGVYTIPLQSTLAGTFVLQASVNGVAITSPATISVTFTPGAPDLTKSTYSVTTKQALANGTDVQNAQAIVMDQYGNAVPGVSVTFAAAPGTTSGKTATLSPSASQTTNAQGVASVNVSATTADTYMVSATVNAPPVTGLITGSQNPQPATFLPGTPINGVLSVGTTAVAADGQTPQVVTATVTDANGSPVPYVEVAFSTVTGATVAAVNNGVTNAQGVATANVTSKLANSASNNPQGYPVTATVTGVTFTPTSVNALFTAGPVSAAKSTVSVDSANVLADGSSKHTITATIMDANGNPVAEQEVDFAVASGSMTLSAAKATTGADGVATITATDTVPESASLTAKVNGQNVTGSPLAVPFSEGAPSPSLSTASASPSSVPADGKTAITITAKIVDANGHALQFVPVNFGVGGAAVASAAGVITDANGNASVTVTDTKAETITDTVTIAVSGQNTPITGSGQTLVFTPGAADAGTSVLSVDSGVVTANNSDTHTVTATIKDANGNPVGTGTVVTFANLSGFGTLTSTTGTTNGSGIATTTVRSDTVGTVQISGSISVGGSPTTISGSPVGAVFSNSGFSSSNSKLNVDTQNVVADGKQTHTVTATVYDTSNNLMPQVTVNFSVPNGSGATLSSASATTGSNGVATVTVTSTTAGQIPVTATVGTQGFTPASVSAVFVPGPMDPASSTLTITQIGVNTPAANGQPGYTVTATLKDANGNVIPQAVVNFSSAAILSATTGTTSSQGSASVTVASKVAGNAQVAATVGGVAVGTPVQGQFVAGPVDLTTSTLSIDTTTAVPAGSGSHTVTALVQDANNNPISGKTVTFTAPANATLSKTSVVTGANGTAVVTVTSTVASSTPYQITGSVTEGALNGSPVGALFGTSQPDPGGPKTSWAVTQTDATAQNVPANGTASFTGTATIGDAEGNLIPGVNVTVDVPTGVVATGSNGQVLAVTNQQATIVTNASGVATVTYTSQVSDTAFKTSAYINTPAVAINGSPQSMTFASTTPDPTKSTWSISPAGPLTVGDGSTSTYTATILLKDSSGNPVKGITSGLTVTSNNAGPTIQTQPTDNGNGSYTVTISSKLAGTYALTAAYNGGQIQQPINVTYNPGPVDLTVSKFSVTQTPVLANGSDVQTATATITDQYGNGIADQTVTFNVGSGRATGSAANPSGNVTGTTNSKGVVSIPITATVPDSYSVSGTLTGSVSGTINGSPQDATFIAGLPVSGQLAIDSAKGVAADGTASHTVTATVEDANGIKLSGVTVNFTAASGATVAPSAVTNVNGVATVTVTSTKANSASNNPNGYSVTPSVTTQNGQSVVFTPASVNALFVAGPPVPGKSTVTIDNNSVLANGTASHTITATVVDAQGNGVSDQTVNFAVTSGQANLSSGTGVTDADGVATITVTSTTVGSAQISATLSGQALSGSPVTAAFTNSPPAPGSSTFVAGTNGAVADGTATDTATATVKDADGHVVSGVTVTFTVQSGTASLVAGAAITDANGQAVATLTSKTAGSITVGATIGVNGQQVAISGSPVSLNFVHGPVVLGNSTITADTNTVADDGVQYHTVTVTAMDANNNPVNNVPIAFALAGGTAASGAQLSATSGSTGADGTLSIQVTSTAKGTVLVSGTVVGQGAVKNSPVTLSYVNGVFNTGKSTLAIDNQNGVVADGKQTHTVTATANDANGQPIEGATVNFTSAQGILTQSSAVTNAAGQAQVQVASTVSGGITVGATVNGQSFTPAQVTANFIPNQMDPTKSLLTISPGTQIADGAHPFTVTATLEDSNGNAIPNAVVTFSGSAAADLSATTATTDANGVATITVTSTQAGNQTVSATVLGVPLGGSPVTAKFVAGDFDVTTSTLSIDSTNDVVADGTSSHTITALLVDKFKNPVAGTTVNFTTSGGKLSASSGTSEANGLVTVTITSTTVGNFDVHGQVASVDLKGSPVTANFGNGVPDVTNSTLTVTQGTVVDDGVATHSATATVLDATKNPVGGVTVAFTVANGAQFSNGTQAITGITGSNGVVTVPITSKTAGTYSVTATLNGAGLVGSPASVTFGPNGGDAKSSSFTVTPAGPILADGKASYTATVTVKDSTGNLVPNAVIDMTSSQSTGLTGLTPTITTNAQGVATATYTSVTAGTYALTASIGADAIATRNLVFLSAAVPPAPTLNPSNGKTVSGNGVPGDTITVTDSAGAQIGTGTIGQDGKFTVNLNPTQSDGVTINAYDVSPSGVQSKPSSVTVDGKAPAAPTVDPSNGSKVTGNGEPGSSITVTTPGSDGNPIVLCTTQADPVTGAFSCVPQPKPSNNEELDVTATDPAGNQSPPTEIVVNTTPPNPPVTKPSNGDEVDGSAQPGSEIDVKDSNGNTLCTTTAGANGSFSCTPLNPKPGDGDKITVTATDPEGNTSDPSTIVVDQTPPTAPVVDPSNGTKVTGTAEPGSTVDVTYNGKSIGSATAGPDGSFTIPLSPKVADGTALGVTATDPAGNTSPSTDITVDGQPPAAPVVNNTNGSKVTGTAEPGSKVVVKDDNGNVLCTTTAGASTGAYTCTPLNPTPGNGDTISVTATDPAGNESAPTTKVISTTPPAAPVVDPSNGTTVKGSAQPGSTVTVSAGNSVLCTTTAAADGSFSCTPNPKPGNGQLVSVTATDDAGNVSAPTQIVVDGIPPAAPVVTGPNTDKPTNDNTPTFTGTGEPGATVNVTTPDGAVLCTTTVKADGTYSCTVTGASGTGNPGTTVTATDPDGNVLCTATVGADGTWSCTPFPDGKDTVNITQTDPAGNVSESTTETLTVDTQAPAAPGVGAPAAGSTVSTGTPEITGTGEPGASVEVKDETGRIVCDTTVTASGTWSCNGSSASGSGQPGQTISLTDNNGNVWCTTTVAADGTWSCPPVSFGNGQHTLTTTQTDAAGNKSESTTTTFTVKQAPTVTSPVNGSTTTNQTPTFTGTASAGDNISITDAAGNVICTTQAIYNNTYSCVVSSQPAGSQTYTVTDTTLGTSTTVTYTTIVVDRIQGADRYSTAAAAAAAEFPNGAKNVIVAVGTNYPDALSAVPAASKLNAPILLTTVGAVPASTMNELNNLHPSQIIVLGTTASVSAAAFNQIQGGVSSKPTVVRIGGVDRYATSRQLAQYVWGSVGISTVFVATGQSFADAEAAAPAAAAAGAPLVLVNGDVGSVDSATTSLLQSFNPTTIHVIGSTSELPNTVYSGLSGLASKVDRISGTTVDATAIAVSQAFFPTSKQVFIARDDDFADALTGGAAAAHVGAPMLLTTTQTLASGVLAEVQRLQANQVHIMGDQYSITNATLSTLVTGLNQTPAAASTNGAGSGTSGSGTSGSGSTGSGSTSTPTATPTATATASQ